MPKYESEIVPAPGAEKPYLAILRVDGRVLLSRLVDTQKAGKALLAEVMRKLPEFEVRRDN